MSNPDNEDPDDDEPGFFAKNRVLIIAGGTIALAAIVWFGVFSKSEKPKKRSAPVTMVTLAPPPPPPTPVPTPPPPQPDQPKPEDKREEFVEETQPEAAPEPAQAPEEAAPMGSNIQGEGSDAFGLRGKGGGGMIGGTGKGQGGSGTKWGWYAGQVQSRVTEALAKHRRTRSASLNLKVRIWADNTGRVTRASLIDSTGDAALDQALQSEILTGLQLQEPPPEDMPMPIVMRITAKRPN